jgi:5-formyltetrahydrofolate cyclo-ligase
LAAAPLVPFYFGTLLFLMNNPVPDMRKELRKQLRAKRRIFNPSQQKQAAQQLVKKLRTHPIFLRSKHIAFYMADDGEISLHYLIIAAEKMGKHCYLPILHPFKKNKLWFGLYRSGDRLLANRFGLPEPGPEKSHHPVWALDLVLMPLVGFDRKGNRLGMGGGFYDRTFAFKKTTDKNNNALRSKCPVLMGVAHHCQEVSGLVRESWDVAMDYVVTDKEIIAVL